MTLLLSTDLLAAPLLLKIESKGLLALYHTYRTLGTESFGAQKRIMVRKCAPKTSVEGILIDQQSKYPYKIPNFRGEFLGIS